MPMVQGKLVQGALEGGVTEISQPSRSLIPCLVRSPFNSFSGFITYGRGVKELPH